MNGTIPAPAPLREEAKMDTKKATGPFQCLPFDKNLEPKWKSQEAFKKWHVDIWTYPVDPTNFGEQVFTQKCRLVGPGPLQLYPYSAEKAGNFFASLFDRYPDLSGGDHRSWEFGETQVSFNWCFITTKGLVELKVAAFDVFCIEKGLVQYRKTEFKMAELLDALNRAYPQSPTAPPQEQVGIDYLWTRWLLEGAPEPRMALRKPR